MYMTDRLRQLLPVFALLAAIGLPGVGRAQQQGPVDQVRSLVSHLDGALALVAVGDVASAQGELQVFDEGWMRIAASVQDRSPSSFQAIAVALANTESALWADSVDPIAAQGAILALRDTATTFVALSRPGVQTMTLYSAQHDYATRGLVTAFEAQTGIAVRVHDGDDFELANQLVAEGSASPADVVVTANSPALMLLSDKGLLTPVSATTLGRVGARYNSPSGDWVGVAARATVLIYNPQLVNEAQLPRSILDLAQPAWKGKLAIAPAEPDFQPVVSAVIKLNGPAAAESWLAGFKQNAAIYNDNEGIVDAVERGQVGAGVVNHYYWFRSAQEAGGAANMHSRLAYFGAGDPGALLDISGAGQLRSAAHPEQAQRFLDFLVSQQGQSALVASGDYEYPLGSGVAPNSQVKPFDQLQAPNLSPGDLGNGEDAVRLLQKVGLI